MTGEDTSRPPLFAVRGDATPEEVAALVAVLSALAAGGAEAPARPPRSEWASPQRAVRGPVAAGPGGWRSSSTPR